MHSVLAGNIEKALGYTSKAIELIHCNQGITTTIITTIIIIIIIIINRLILVEFLT